ncbi:hypothetical protein K501DRAFT_282279 [Backusella circina FSU 941]|nr:hypothetical protein K501DRAFT_282279 [Backusella circina FSU 941]
MAEYLGNEVGQEEFTAELHKREMAMLERRAAQINERLKMILRIEQLQVLEKELKDKIDKTENMTEESTTSEDDANSDSTAE